MKETLIPAKQKQLVKFYCIVSCHVLNWLLWLQILIYNSTSLDVTPQKWLFILGLNEENGKLAFNLKYSEKAVWLIEVLDACVDLLCNDSLHSYFYLLY